MIGGNDTMPADKAAAVPQVLLATPGGHQADTGLVVG